MVSKSSAFEGRDRCDMREKGERRVKSGQDTKAKGGKQRGDSRLRVLGAAGLSSGFASSHFERGWIGGLVRVIGRIEKSRGGWGREEG